MARKRLPTEAEFEFAARGGLSGKIYVWGDELYPGDRFMANTLQGLFPVRDTGKDGFAGVAPVKSFPANGYGLYDIAGNVWEWTSDWYRPDYYAQLAARGAVVRNPQGPEQGQFKVLRGGSWSELPKYLLTYGRFKLQPDTRNSYTGFRCAKSVPH